MLSVLFIVLAGLITMLPEFSGIYTAPEGFVEYRIKKGDVLGKIANSEAWDLIRKVNRIDERHLPIGKNILIPTDMEKAGKFLPVPQSIKEAETENRLLCVFLDSQYFGAYENGQLSFWGPISSGKKGRGTPAGKFNVLWKTKFYHSKKYDADMPFAVNISKSGYFLHEQSLPGKPASHGCIRLLRQDAKTIYDWIKKNDPVIISNSSETSGLFYFAKFI